MTDFKALHADVMHSPDWAPSTQITWLRDNRQAILAALEVAQQVQVPALQEVVPLQTRASLDSGASHFLLADRIEQFIETKGRLNPGAVPLLRACLELAGQVERLKDAASKQPLKTDALKAALRFHRDGSRSCEKHGSALVQGKTPLESCIACQLEAENASLTARIAELEEIANHRANVIDRITDENASLQLQLAAKERGLAQLNVREMLLRNRISELEAPPLTITTSSTECCDHCGEWACSGHERKHRWKQYDEYESCGVCGERRTLSKP